MNQVQERISRLLQAEMESKGMKLRSLGRKIGIGASSMHDYLHMECEPRNKNLEKIANYFHKTVAELLSNTTRPPDTLDETDAEILQTLGQFNQSEKKAILEDLKDKLLLKAIKSQGR